MTPEQSKIHEGILLLQKKVHTTAVEHGWWESGDRNMGEMIALMHSELSEALESYRDSEPPLFYTLKAEEAKQLGMHGDQKWEGPAYLTTLTGGPVLGKPEGIATEFADTIIRIADTCEKLGIPLAQALVEKMAYNDTRPYRHGGRKI